MAAAPKRSVRVSELLRSEISQIVMREISDPWVKPITITAVKLTDDLKRSIVYYCLFGDEDAWKQAGIGLERAKKYIKRKLGERLHLRYIPEITFKTDQSIDYGMKIEKLLREARPEEADETVSSTEEENDDERIASVFNNGD